MLVIGGKSDKYETKGLTTCEMLNIKEYNKNMTKAEVFA